jgi:protoporphyrinogen oxidase
MSLTRREMLCTLLGTPLALTACRRQPRSVPGQMVGARVDVGHRLLDATVERVQTPFERVGVLVVGAGLSGLSAAWKLDRLGERDYRVLDLESQPGGTSASGRDGVVPYPWGAHYVPVPRAEQQDLVALLEELGALERDAAGNWVGSESARIRAPEERLFLDGSWHEGLFPSARASGEDLRQWAAFQRHVDTWVGFRDARGRRAFTLPLRECSDAAEVVALDRVSADSWLRDQRFDSKLLRWYVEYGCRDDYGASLQQTSAWAMLFYFCSRVTLPGGPSAPFLSWPEGNGRIVDHLRGKVAGRLRLNQLVTDVRPSAGFVDVVAFDASTNAAVRYRADQVILAVPKFVVRRVLRAYRDAPPAHLAAFRYGAWLVANLHLTDRPRSVGFPLAWDNVLYDSHSLGYVVASHQVQRDLGPTVWTYYRPFSEVDGGVARKLLQALDHRTAVDSVLTDLGRAHANLDSLTERVDVMRWGHAMVTPVPGFIWGAERRRAAEPRGNVFFAHSDLSGLPLLEEALDRGVVAAEAVVEQRRSE